MRSHPATTLEVSHHSIFWRTGLVTVNNQAKPAAGENFLQTALFRPVSSNLSILNHTSGKFLGGNAPPPFLDFFKNQGELKIFGGEFPPAYWTLILYSLMYFLALRIAKKYREITSAIYRSSRKFDKIVNFGALFLRFFTHNSIKC